MAANYIKNDRSKIVPQLAAAGMQRIRDGVEMLVHARDIFLQQRDGDGSQASHYDFAATEGGFQAGDYADANAACKASFDEIDSLLAKVNTDNAVSNVKAAIYQCCAKHGV